MILLVYGTRPEFIKIKPLIEEMEDRGFPFKTLFTGQHKDLISYDATYSIELKDDGSNRLDSIIKGCMSLPNEWFEGISHILVQGDTTSVVGMALTAMHRKIKVIHLEAGLRSFDTENPFPEENNRKIVTSIADLHLCPTGNNMMNLRIEGVDKDKIHVVGNTGLDGLLHVKNMTYDEKYILVTLHRRENHDILDEWFNVINELAGKYPKYKFIIPLHPNPNVQKHKHLLSNVLVTAPMEHDEMITIMLKSKLVITDSGGIQEECSFFNKRCLVCRKVTERPEALLRTSVIIPTPKDLLEKFEKYYKESYVKPHECPFGDGHASQKICDIFEKLIYV